MKSLIFIFCALILLGLSSSLARADILFVNINLNFQEEEVARKAAAARHENFIVIPVLSDAQKKFLSDIKKEDGEKFDSDKRLASIFPPSGWIDVHRSIHEALSNLDKNHRQLSSFIISSHHVSRFYGAIGPIDDLDLYTLLKTHPSAQSLKGFYGWGCYTTEPQMALEIRRELPQVAILAGWDGVAPSETRAADTGILSYMLTHEDQAIWAENKHTLRNYIENIPFVGKSMGVTNFGMEVCGDLETPHESIRDISDTSKLCSHRSIFGDGNVGGLMNQLRFTYLSYNNGDQPIPTDLEHSDLRKFYDSTQILEACPDVVKLKLAHQFPTDEQIAHLIHFANGFDNFLQYYKQDIEKMQQLLKENNFPVTTLTAKMNKKDIARYQASLASLIKDLTLQKADAWKFWQPHPSELEINSVREMASTINTILLQNKCVPDQWNDPVNTKEPISPNSRCLLNPP